MVKDQSNGSVLNLGKVSSGEPLTVFPILEFDPSRKAIVNPWRYGMTGPVPDRGVLCFFQDVIAELVKKKVLRQIGALRSELMQHPVFTMKHKGKNLFVVHPGIGAPLAAGILEEITCWGIKNVVVCGGCGVLKPEIAAGHVVVITQAVRDEGTSYHYLPPGRKVKASREVTKALEITLQAHNIPYSRGITWTTDAIFRETAARREARMKEGCIVVEMEAAALFAVAKFRKVKIGQIVYGGDMVVPDGWDAREWYKRKRERRLLFDLAVETCCRL